MAIVGPMIVPIILLTTLFRAKEISEYAGASMFTMVIKTQSPSDSINH